MPQPEFTLLAIDDEPILLRSLTRILAGASLTVHTATDPEQGLALMESEAIDLVLLDLQMPGREGLSVLEDLVKLYPDVPVIMLTGQGNVATAVRAIKLGAAEFLEKPCPPDTLRRVLDHYRSMRQQKTSLPLTVGRDFDFPDLVGDSPVMRQLKSLIPRAAASEAPILILGESGTGKELVARAIHHHSPRHQGPFCAVDCAAINESVLESELFGYEKGAFTGADKATLGLIRAANGGTLFLDEIGELPPKMQAKLLRTLQEREVRPVGSTRSQPVDIRIIAATNRDLVQEISRGQFRSDLYFRISAIPVFLAPLRERREDIGLLSDHILARLATGRPKPLSPAALRLLGAYDWPGNVRELENVLRRALALCEQEAILPQDLPATLVVQGPDDPESAPEGDSLVAYEQSALENALRKTNNNKRKAAALLGISEATLYRKLKQFGLSS